MHLIKKKIQGTQKWGKSSICTPLYACTGNNFIFNLGLGLLDSKTELTTKLTKFYVTCKSVEGVHMELLPKMALKF